MEMISTFWSSLEVVCLNFIPIILAITLHEAAHGYVALKLGDDTALKAGRVSFNPFRHVDPVGTLLIPGILYLTHAPFLIGYAKPVPVNGARLGRPRRDMALVAAAGPAMNILLSLASILTLKLTAGLGDGSGTFFIQTLAVNMVKVNLFIGLFNLLPILPLDGGRIFLSLLPGKAARDFAKHEPYGMMIVLGLVLLLPWALRIDPLGNLLRWEFSLVLHFLLSLFGLT